MTAAVASDRTTVRYWTWAFALMTVGGIGGGSGHWMRWTVLMLPHPVGWLLAFQKQVRFRLGPRHVIALHDAGMGGA